MSSNQVKFMATTKIERAGISFGIGRHGGSIVIEVRPHHDTISALRGVQFGFELLNGITVAQGKKTSGSAERERTSAWWSLHGPEDQNHRSGSFFRGQRRL